MTRFHVKPKKKSGDRIVSAPLTGGVRAHMRSSAVECRERRSDERLLEGPLPRGGLTCVNDRASQASYASLSRWDRMLSAGIRYGAAFVAL